MGFGVLGTFVTTGAALFGRPVGGAAAAAQLKALGPLDHLWTLAVTVVSIVAYVDLFRLKRRALPLIVAIFLVGLATVGANLALRPDYRAMFHQGYWPLFVGWGINLAIIAYVWRLRGKGVLK
jgi:peptidoglycan/LPS O-acetylase OafA/YrhL